MSDATRIARDLSISLGIVPHDGRVSSSEIMLRNGLIAFAAEQKLRYIHALCPACRHGLAHVYLNADGEQEYVCPAEIIRAIEP